MNKLGCNTYHLGLIRLFSLPLALLWRVFPLLWCQTFYFWILYFKI